MEGLSTEARLSLSAPAAADQRAGEDRQIDRAFLGELEQDRLQIRDAAMVNVEVRLAEAQIRGYAEKSADMSSCANR